MSLIDDILDAEFDPASNPGGIPIPGEPDPRWLLKTIRRNERESERLRTTMRGIVAAYEARIDTIEEAIEQCRDSLRGWLIHENEGHGISFPDVGRATLRTVQASVKVVDKTMAEAVARELGCVQEVPDMQAAKAKVLEGATKGTGEIPPGFEVLPERKTLVVGS